MNFGGIIHGYTVKGGANGYIIGRSPDNPNPYVVWKIGHNDVCCGHYFNNREEAERYFCARAFEWIKDNVNIHMIEDGNNQNPLEQTLIGGLKKIKADLAAAAQIIDEMCAEVDRLRKERHNDNNNNQRL